MVIEWEIESGPSKTCALLTSIKLVFDMFIAMTVTHYNACDAYTGVELIIVNTAQGFLLFKFFSGTGLYVECV